MYRRTNRSYTPRSTTSRSRRARWALWLPMWAVLLQPIGCIGVQSNDARQFTPFPPATIAGSEKVDVGVQVVVEVSGTPASAGVRANTQGKVQGLYMRYLRETNRASVTGRADYEARVRVKDQGGSFGARMAAVLTGLTLYVIPSWLTHEYTTTIELHDLATGRSVAAKTYKHELTFVQQLFTVFAMPFSGIEKRYDEMWEAVMKDAAVWTVESLSP